MEVSVLSADVSSIEERRTESEWVWPDRRSTTGREGEEGRERRKERGREGRSSHACTCTCIMYIHTTIHFRFVQTKIILLAHACSYEYIQHMYTVCTVYILFYIAG